MSIIVCVLWSKSKGKVPVEVLRVPIEAVRVLYRRSLQSLKCEEERGCVKKYFGPRSIGAQPQIGEQHCYYVTRYRYSLRSKIST